MGLLTIGLIAAALGVISYEVFDKESDDDFDPDTLPEDGELYYDGSDTLYGTEGDDTLAETQTEDSPETILLRGGDDVAISNEENQFDSMEIRGGEGNDTIGTEGYVNYLYGDAGDDVLSGTDSNNLYGGEGNDILNFRQGTYGNEDGSTVDGGEGEDTINLRGQALIPEFVLSDVSHIRATGGSGADTFNVTYEVAEEFDGGSGLIIGTHEDITYAGDLFSIRDFDPTEDSLLVEMVRDDASDTEPLDVTAELEQTQLDDGTFESNIIMTFGSVENAVSATTTLRVFSATAFTMDDVELRL